MFRPHAIAFVRRSIWICLLQTAVAQSQVGDLTYVENGNAITITKCASSASGALTLPATICGKPVTRIGAQAFAFCTKITSVAIPEGVDTIEDGAFLNCTGLVTASLPGSLRSLGASALYSCSSLKSLTIPPGITSLSSSLLGNCYSLASVTLPAGITGIGASAFSGCTSLTSVVIPASVTSIESNAFFSCTKLASVSLPAGLQTIALKAFADCASLTVIDLPASLASIGDNAFTGCASLGSVHLPASLLSLGAEVFRSCAALTAITVDPANAAFSSRDGVLFNKAQSSLLAYPCGRGGSYVVPAGVSTIVPSAFRNTSGSLNSVSLPASLRSIGDFAFASCKGLLELEIPASVTAIGNSAFRYNNALTRATFAGDAPSTFGSYVFSSAAAGFTVHYHQCADGFSSPTWRGYPSSAIAESDDPVGTWLSSLGQRSTADIGTVDLSADENGDGVNLLMAYALNLDPEQNLAGRMPQPVVAGNQLSMSYYSGAAGVTYRVETSGNLRDWTTEGVTISPPDANQVRTASVPAGSGARYLRLFVSYDPQPAS